MITTNEITVQIRCYHLPETAADLRLGIQKGQDVIEDVPATTSEVIFVVPLTLKTPKREGAASGTGSDAGYDFAGAFVHGKVGERFLYLCWGTRYGDAWGGVGRAKFPLRYLSTAKINEALETGQPIHVAVDMTDVKGRPICATLPPQSLTW